MNRTGIADQLSLAPRTVSNYMRKWKDERQPEVDAMEAEHWNARMEGVR